MARTPIHPGEILADELEEIGLTAKRLADVIEVPPNRLYQLLSGKRNVTADTALRLAQYFGMSADFWMNLQSAHDLARGRPDRARQQSGTPTENSKAQRDGGAAACSVIRPLIFQPRTTKEISHPVKGQRRRSLIFPF